MGLCDSDLFLEFGYVKQWSKLLYLDLPILCWKISGDFGVEPVEDGDPSFHFLVLKQSLGGLFDLVGKLMIAYVVFACGPNSASVGPLQVRKMAGGWGGRLKPVSMHIAVTI